MANYNNLKTAISEVIKTNGNEEITGALLQQSLLAMINALGVGYQFVGIAQPDTLPGAVDYRCFYIAAKAGTYSHFNDIEVEDGELALLVWDTDWTKQSIVLGVADGAVTETKIADGSITGDKFSPGLTLYMNQQFTYLKQVQVKYGEDPSAAIKSFAQRDNKTALYIKLKNGLLVPANTNGETASGLYSYGNTIRKVLFDGTNWSDIEIQNDIIDTAHIKDGSVTTDKIADKAVTSSKLATGARKPIILTPSTTEVDEETYQKLLSDDVDAVFTTDSGNICTLTFKDDYETSWYFYFTCLSREADGLEGIFLYGEEVNIQKSAPHKVTINSLPEGSLDDIISEAGFIYKYTLSAILKKINLIKGDNSAVIKQFEADWKNLNGSLDGARFIGFPAGTLPVLFMRSDLHSYIGYTDRDIDGGSSEIGPFKKITLSVANNYNIEVRDVPATVQYIDLNATITNLTSIGSVQQNTPHCFTYTKDSEIIKGVGQVWQSSYYGYLDGISFDGKYRVYAEVQANGAATVTLTPIDVQKLLQPILQKIDLTGTDADRKAKLVKFETDWKALTGADNLEGARFVGRVLINEEDGSDTLVLLNYDIDDKYNGISMTDLDVTALKKVTVNLSDGSIQVTPLFSHLEAITIKPNNSTTSKAKNVAAIKEYVDNLEALGVDITKGFLIPISVEGQGSGFISRMSGIDSYNGVMISRGIPSFGIYVDAAGGYYAYKSQTETDNSLTTTSKKIVSAINEVNALAKGVKAFGAIELKASDNAANKAAVTAYLKILTDAGVSITNGYSVPVRITGNSQEYHGMLNIGTGVLLSGVVTDVNENHHYPFNVSTTDGVITFDENNYFLEKGSNEVTEMLDAIKYSYTAVPFTDTTLSNKAQLEVFLSKVPNATVMHCTYKEIWAGTLHKINGDWYGLLVKNTNSPADNINVKLSADGTIVTSNSVQ